MYIYTHTCQISSLITQTNPKTPLHLHTFFPTTMFPTMTFIHDQESFQENAITMQQSVVDNDEADETLSLCDLEIYNDSATSQENDISSSSASCSSSLSSEQDLFEFFSEETSINSLTTFLPSDTSPDIIIFCGKIIAYKQPRSPKNPKMSRGLFRWNSDKRASEANTITNTPPRSKSLPIPDKYNNDFVPNRMSIFQSPTKSRWYLFFFGMGGFPRKMEMSDIRNRQIRRSPSTMFRVEGGGDKEEVVVGGAAGSQTKVVGKAAKVGCFGGF